MIKYQLICEADHVFDIWFRNSADFDRQAEIGLIECPLCGNENVRKAVMAPAIARGGAERDKRLASIRRDMTHAVQRARDYVEKNFDYVGEKFPEEARKIHYGESKERGIYGEASGRDVRDLIDEGINVAPIPAAKPDKETAEKPGPAPAKKRLN